MDSSSVVGLRSPGSVSWWHASSSPAIPVKVVFNSERITGNKIEFFHYCWWSLLQFCHRHVPYCYSPTYCIAHCTSFCIAKDWWFFRRPLALRSGVLVRFAVALDPPPPLMILCELVARDESRRSIKEIQLNLVKNLGGNYWIIGEVSRGIPEEKIGEIPREGLPEEIPIVDFRQVS